MGRIIDRKGPAFVILPGFILTGSGMMMIGIAHNTWQIVIAAVLVAMGSGGALPAIQTDCLKRLDAKRRTVATGTYMIGMDIGMGAGPIFGGIITDMFNFRVAYTSTGFLMLAGFGCYLLYRRISRQALI
jgi:MFS family permease